MQGPAPIAIGNTEETMSSMRAISGASLAAAAALILAAGAATYGNPAQAAEVQCSGINACKGTSACKTASNACKGQNACKGTGFSMASEKECAAKGAKFVKG